MDVNLDAFLEKDAHHREVLTLVESARAEIKVASTQLGGMSEDERESALVELQNRKKALKLQEATERNLREEVRAWAMQLPMPPAADVPDGKDDSENLEIRRVGKLPEFIFPPKSHQEIGESLGMLDIPRGVKLAGSRNFLLLGDLALLEQAVLRMALHHMVKRGFQPVAVPMLVTRECMEGTGYFPGGEEQAYLSEKDDLSLIGTSEVPLTSIHSGEKLLEDDLPLRRVALSPCFRREAGTYGKDTKGLYRVHQFWKVEQVVLGPNDREWSEQEHLRMLAHATDLVDLLELPYRVVNVCSGDLGQGQVQKFDIETWMPSRKSYGETHSASRFFDFQSRRLDLRYRPTEGGKPKFCHTLNNTVIASPRVLIALLENHQQKDGSVAIPKALQPFFGNSVLAKPQN
jgi:seryl-tRNA synthetase